MLDLQQPFISIYLFKKKKGGCITFDHHLKESFLFFFFLFKVESLITLNIHEDELYRKNI